MTAQESGRNDPEDSPQIVQTSDAPEPVGPYSQAVMSGDLIFCSGQLGIDPVSGAIVQGDVADQARRALRNLSEILEASGSRVANVLKVTVYVRNIKDFALVNQVYADFFGEYRPSRSVVEVSGLPKNALIEIDLIAKR
ncbi:MAG: hypothetical protein IH630_05195 [Thermoplasmata archaeon]|nr:hypothetical protein [Thermoplasmata archaeon]